MESLTIPKDVTSIGNQAFVYCTELQSVTLPESLTSIGDGAFNQCDSLPAINVAAENTAFSSRDGILYNKAQTTLVQCPAGKTGVIEVPDGVTTIAGDAFSSCKKVTGVTLPEGLSSVGYYAFNVCEGLTSMTFPASVTSIGNAIFNGCTGLKEIRFEGPAPILNGSIFVGVTATAYYPGDDSSWTREVRESCGGNITWVPTPNPFTDVKASKYYYMPVLWAYYHDPRITGGTGDGTTFSPNETCTRAQIVTFLWKAAGAPEPVNTQNSFTDVKPKHYFYKAVLWAVENGITSGTSPTTFGPNVPCTRAEVVTFIWSFADRPEPKTTDNPFKDVSSGKYYYKAVLWAYENEITGGVSANTFGPKVVCTRGQIVTFLYKYMEG